MPTDAASLRSAFDGHFTTNIKSGTDPLFTLFTKYAPKVPMGQEKCGKTVAFLAY